RCRDPGHDLAAPPRPLRPLEGPRELGFRSAVQSVVDHRAVTGHLGLAYEPARLLEGGVAGTPLVEQYGSDRAGDRAGPPVDRERPGGNEEAETLGEVAELGALDVRGEHYELLAAPAEDEVAGAQLAAQPLVDVHEQGVPGGVAV